MEKLSEQQPTSPNEIRRKLVKGEITPQMAYDGYVALGIHPLVARNDLFNDLGGTDIISPETEERNQRASELMKDLVEAPVPRPDFRWTELREVSEEFVTEADPEDRILPIMRKLVTGQISADEATSSLIQAGHPADEIREEVQIALAQMRAVDGSP